MVKNQRIKKYALLLGVLFLFPGGLLLLLKSMNHNFTTLPYIGAFEVEAAGDTSWNIIQPFSLLNQNGNTFTPDSLKGAVWVAAFFPTHSEYVLNYSKRLLTLNHIYKTDRDVKIVCFSNDSLHDTPEVLTAFLTPLIKHNISNDKWHFLAGYNSEVERVAREEFLIEDISDHSIFYLVDKRGYVRGHYNAQKESEIGRLEEDISLLLKEDLLRRKGKLKE